MPYARAFPQIRESAIGTETEPLRCWKTANKRIRKTLPILVVNCLGNASEQKCFNKIR